MHIDSLLSGPAVMPMVQALQIGRTPKHHLSQADSGNPQEGEIEVYKIPSGLRFLGCEVRALGIRGSGIKYVDSFW